jgi:uncharacterized protein (TIGR03437 family)
MSKRWSRAVLAICLLGCEIAGRAQTINPLIDYSTYLGTPAGQAQNDVAYGIAADMAGNAYITGDAPSGQLPVTTGIAATTGNTGFVAKLSPDGAHLLYATYLNLPPGRAIAVDAQGSAYVAGSSANATYIVKLTPDGSALAYRYLFPPSSGSGTSAVLHLVLDSAQNVYVSGNTSDTAFPTTPGSYQSTYPGQAGTAYGFLIKLDASGRVVYSTYTGVPVPQFGQSLLAVDGKQNALILTSPFTGSGLSQATLVTLNATGDSATSTTFPNAATPIAVWSMGTDPSGNLFITGKGSLSPNSQGNLVAQLDSTGAVVKGRYIPYLGNVYVDNAGNALVVGVSGSLCPPGCVPYVTRVDSSFSRDGTFILGSVSAVAATGTPDQIYAAALDPVGNVYLTLSNSVVSRLNQVPATPGAFQTSGGAFAVVKMDAAGLAGNATPVLDEGGLGVIAPGEILPLYGYNLGPAQLVVAGPDSNGSFPTTLAGTRLLIGGQAVPLLYSSAGQISGLAPLALTGDANGLTTIQVEYQGVGSAVVTATVVPTSPSLFGVVVNQNGTINSPANPAAPGSVVWMYCSGCGVTVPPGVDGALATSIAWLATGVGIYVGDQIATVAYAGAAPGLLNGIAQINVVIPSGISGDALGIGIYSGSSPLSRGAKVSVR